MTGFTIVPGSCLRTPPTAPVTPLSSCSWVAMVTRSLAVPPIPCENKGHVLSTIVEREDSISCKYIIQTSLSDSGCHHMVLATYSRDNIVCIGEPLSEVKWFMGSFVLVHQCLGGTLLFTGCHKIIGHLCKWLCVCVCVCCVCVVYACMCACGCVHVCACVCVCMCVCVYGVSNIFIETPEHSLFSKFKGHPSLLNISMYGKLNMYLICFFRDLLVACLPRTWEATGKNLT